MINDPTNPVINETIETDYVRPFYQAISWRAILAGTVAAMGIHLLLTSLGVAAGLAIFTPKTDVNPVSHFSVGAAFIWDVCAIIALWFGGLIAGRFSSCALSGFIHGVLVWSLTVIIAAFMLSVGTGLVLGGGLKVLTAGISAAGKAAATGLADVTKVNAQRTSDYLNSFIQEAVQSVPTNAAPKAATRAGREISFAVIKLFAPGNDINSPQNRALVINALVEYTQMTPADATKTLDDWTASYRELKIELDHAKAVAEQKARDEADQAAHNLACAALWSFFALVLGLVASALGASCAAKHTYKYGRVKRTVVN